MVLSDKDIRKRLDDGSLSIEPLVSDNIEPASVDLRLGSHFKRPTGLKHPWSNVVDLNDTTDIQYEEFEEYIVLYPDDFVLATTLENVTIPDDLCAKVLGRSSLGRLGISVHQTAGYIDPGFTGQITLELTNHSAMPIQMTEGDRICQIVFEELNSPAETPYGHVKSQYQNQSGATGSGMNFE